MRLAELRKTKNISQSELGRAVHIAQSTISRYENGKQDLRILELLRIADYFNVSADYLLERTDNPQINR